MFDASTLQVCFIEIHFVVSLLCFAIYVFEHPSASANYQIEMNAEHWISFGPQEPSTKCDLPDNRQFEHISKAVVQPRAAVQLPSSGYTAVGDRSKCGQCVTVTIGCYAWNCKSYFQNGDLELREYSTIISQSGCKAPSGVLIFSSHLHFNYRHTRKNDRGGDDLHRSCKILQICTRQTSSV
jgi:hypothetical protein